MTHVGNVREHNEDSFYFDQDQGMFLVCDGMGGHAAGEVASAIAIKTIRERWADPDTIEVADVWLDRGTAIAKKQLIEALREGVLAAHDAIIAEGVRDPTKQGMGTTLVGAMVVGNELVFAHCGDSRAYIVRDGISMQLTEDHTLLQRLLAAGIDVDVTGDGARFRSMLTNALGIGQECKVSTFVVPLADGDRFMLCSDGISEYVPENEVGEVLVKQPSPARAAQRLVELALERGGGDNATAIVVRVLEAGETPVPAEQRRRDDLSISLCELWSEKVTPQQRLRALRIAIPRDHAGGETLPAHTLGDRVAWIVVEGEVLYDGEPCGPGAFIYPESLIAGSKIPDKDGLALAKTEVRAIAIRNDDFRELCEDDAELGEALLERLGQIIAAKKPRPHRPKLEIDPYGKTIAQAPTDPNMKAIGNATTDPNIKVVSPSQSDPNLALGRAATMPPPVSGPPAPTPEAAFALSRAATPPAGLPATKAAAPAKPAAEAQLSTMASGQHAFPRPLSEPEIVIEMNAEEPDDGVPSEADDEPVITMTREEPERVPPEPPPPIRAATSEPLPTVRSKRASEGWDD